MTHTCKENNVEATSLTEFQICNLWQSRRKQQMFEMKLKGATYKEIGFAFSVGLQAARNYVLKWAKRHNRLHDVYCSRSGDASVIDYLF